MSIIKGTNQIVAGFGGTKRPLGEVYFSQSSLATDNPGALPGWTGEYYENGKTLFPDLYNFVKAHSELQVTKAQYDNAIATYGECPKYVVDENSGTTTGTITVYGWLASGSTFYTKTRNPVAGDSVWPSTDTTQESIYTVISLSNDTLTFSGPTKEWSGTYSTTTTGTGLVTTLGTSLRLPKYQKTGRYLIKKEVNGNNWYNLYSDGWLEQGGYFANPSTIGTGAITETFFKPYSTPPTVLFGNMSTRHNAAYDSEHYPYNVTATGFTHENVQPEGQGTRWYAFGYAAATPMENIMYPWISAYTSAIPASTAQAAEFQQALSSKADTSLSNLSTAGKDLASGLGMPSNRYIDLTLGASSSSYTAPANGYFVVRVPFTGNQACALFNTTTLVGINLNSNGTWTAYGNIPVKNNDVVQLWYNCTPNLFRFVYAEGDK